MFKVFLGFVLALAIAIVIRVVYGMGREAERRRGAKIFRSVAEIMQQAHEAELEKKKPVRKKK